MENSTANKKNLRKRPGLARTRRAHKEYTLTHRVHTHTQMNTLKLMLATSKKQKVKFQLF